MKFRNFQIRNGRLAPALDFGRREGVPAFTLMEVLIAVAAFSIVLSAITSVFYGALRLRNASSELFERDLAVQHTLSLLRKDMANLVPPGGTFFGPLQSAPNNSTAGTGSSGGSVSGLGSGSGSSGAGGGASSMALLAAASRPGQSSPEFYTSNGRIDETSPWADVQRVSYYLAASTNAVGARDLIRSVTRNLLPSIQEQPIATPLLSGVESIYFQYFDGTQWKETWDSASETGARLPAAIRAQITLASEERGKAVPAPIELVVPILVFGGTNSTGTSTGTTSTQTGGGSGGGGGGAGGGAGQGGGNR